MTARVEPMRSGRTRGRVAERHPAQLFAAEAERIATLCHAMAERFARGGRLLAIGCSRRRAPTPTTWPWSSSTR